MWKFWKKDSWTPVKEEIRHLRMRITEHLDELAKKNPGAEIKYSDRLKRAEREQFDFKKQSNLKQILGDVQKEIKGEGDERLKRKSRPFLRPPV